RRRTTSNRVDLPKIAGAIAFDQRGKIDQMDNDRREQPGPGRRSRHAHQWCKRERHDTGADGNQGRRRERIETDLYQGIPARMACGRKQNSEKYKGFHEKALMPGPIRSARWTIHERVGLTRTEIK